ncbi:putative cytochrome P450 9f2 [Pseudolycoriella hygida]|uniref:Cytochrome P450 9f2 n=1 Tax=Pseudolycoriella hygida TaxID=35572 RepID=A0A9Q0RWI3_9DIPT|nr:putative cytochrome P450 9f2 [Pseudolycoriella hygida]
MVTNMIGELVLISAVVLLLFSFYKKMTVNDKYFERQNIKYLKPKFVVGNTGAMYFNKIDPVEIGLRFYNAFPDEPVFGIFDFQVPYYVVRLPEVIKKIGVKDFDYFQDHREFTDANTDKMWGNTIIMMRGEKWRQMRATLSPAFTGSKMRQMFELVSECADDIVQYFSKKSKNNEDINVEMKDLFTRYTNDVIATCAFGLKINSFEDPENTALNIEFLDASFATFFRNLILDTMEVRKNQNIYRPDMISLLMQARDGKLTHSDEKHALSKESFATVDESDIDKAVVNRTWNDDEIVAQCFGFFFAGFETGSTLLTFSAYELVVNPEVQQKLYEEIAKVNEQLGGQRIDYDTLQKMKYLDQVLCESLRKWPPIVQTDRNCVKEHVFDCGNGIKINAEKGALFFFPIIGLHRDPKYFPDPDRFDPERFSDENKISIVPGTYMPFGIGPRNCIGSRFALMEIKAILYYLLLNFSFEACEKTQIPVKLQKIPFSLKPENGMHVKLRKRQ